MIKKIAKTILVWILFLVVLLAGMPFAMLGGADWLIASLSSVSELAEEWKVF